MSNMELKECELIVVIIMTIATLTTSTLGGIYMWKLHKEIRDHIYIGGDVDHSQWHFGITGMLIVLSIMMFSNSFAGDMQALFYQHLLYNMVCIFGLLPHLMSEKSIKQ